ncbi:Uncharacterised protein [Mycobacteroides abscessus subsp. abscessus]|nr:Uncharacterised protein [Mycobacteroides abscessus subsp. abscessus]
MAGVFRVWFDRELAAATARFSDSGTQRSPRPVTCSARASAAGEQKASHSPPSEEKFFCGAK